MQLVVDAIVKYWITAICGVFAGMIALLWKKINNERKENKAIKGAVLALLRNQIKQSCQTHIEHGYINSVDYQVLDDMFTQYFAMGGNGVVAHMKDSIQKLELRVVESGK